MDNGDALHGRRSYAALKRQLLVEIALESRSHVPLRGGTFRIRRGNLLRFLLGRELPCLLILLVFVDDSAVLLVLRCIIAGDAARANPTRHHLAVGRRLVLCGGLGNAPSVVFDIDRVALILGLGCLDVQIIVSVVVLAVVELLEAVLV